MSSSSLRSILDWIFWFHWSAGMFKEGNITGFWEQLRRDLQLYYKLTLNLLNWCRRMRSVRFWSLWFYSLIDPGRWICWYTYSFEVIPAILSYAQTYYIYFLVSRDYRDAFRKLGIFGFLRRKDQGSVLNFPKRRFSCRFRIRRRNDLAKNGYFYVSSSLAPFMFSSRTPAHLEKRNRTLINFSFQRC